MRTLGLPTPFAPFPFSPLPLPPSRRLALFFAVGTVTILTEGRTGDARRVRERERERAREREGAEGGRDLHIPKERGSEDRGEGGREKEEAQRRPKL